MTREAEPDENPNEPWRPPTAEERAEFRKLLNERIASRLDMFETNAPKYAKALGTFREALKKSGFSDDESMQIILRVAELPGGRPGFGGLHGHRRWHKG